MGVGSLGWRDSAYYHILRLFKVKRSLKLIFLDLSYILYGTIDLSSVIAALKLEPSEPKMCTP